MPSPRTATRRRIPGATSLSVLSIPMSAGRHTLEGQTAQGGKPSSSVRLLQWPHPPSACAIRTCRPAGPDRLVGSSVPYFFPRIVARMRSWIVGQCEVQRSRTAWNGRASRQGPNCGMMLPTILPCTIVRDDRCLAIVKILSLASAWTWARQGHVPSLSRLIFV
jgi:hypothetical protein